MSARSELATPQSGAVFLPALLTAPAPRLQQGSTLNPGLHHSGLSVWSRIRSSDHKQTPLPPATRRVHSQSAELIRQSPLHGQPLQFLRHTKAVGQPAPPHSERNLRRLQREVLAFVRRKFDPGSLYPDSASRGYLE